MRKSISHFVIPALALLGMTFACQQSSLRVTDTTSSVIPLDESLNGSKELEAYIAPYKDSLNAQMSQILGHASKKLTNGIPESTLSNFTTDLLLSETRLYCQNAGLPEPDIALVNHKGLRAIIDKGPITLNNIYRLMPFENEVVLLTLSKKQVVTLLNYMASIGGDGIAGVSFEINNNIAHNIRINQLKLNKEKYVVATSDYLANGGDNYSIFKEAETRTGTGLKLRDVIMNHIKKLNEKDILIDANLDNRIRYATK